MTTLTLPKTYHLKWQFKADPKYKISECRKIINTLTGRELKQTVVGYSKGFWIGRKFILTSCINSLVEKIPHLDLPF